VCAKVCQQSYRKKKEREPRIKVGVKTWEMVGGKKTTDDMVQGAHDVANVVPLYRGLAAVNNGKSIGEVANEVANPYSQLEASTNVARKAGGDKIPGVAQTLQLAHAQSPFGKEIFQSANSKEVTGIAKVCAEVCQQSYKGDRTPIEVDDEETWEVVEDNTETNCIAYSCGGELIVGIKGTDPKEVLDIAADIHMFCRTRDSTARFKEADDFINSTMRNGSKWTKIYLTGHSLGGSIVYDSFYKFKKCYQCHMFNPYFKGENDSDDRKVFLHRTLGDLFSNSWPTNEAITVKTYECPGDPMTSHNKIGGGTTIGA